VWKLLYNWNKHLPAKQTNSIRILIGQVFYSLSISITVTLFHLNISQQNISYT